MKLPSLTTAFGFVDRGSGAELGTISYALLEQVPLERELDEPIDHLLRAAGAGGGGGVGRARQGVKPMRPRLLACLFALLAVACTGGGPPR